MKQSISAFVVVLFSVILFTSCSNGIRRAPGTMTIQLPDSTKMTFGTISHLFPGDSVTIAKSEEAITRPSERTWHIVQRGGEAEKSVFIKAVIVRKIASMENPPAKTIVKLSDGTKISIRYQHGLIAGDIVTMTKRISGGTPSEREWHLVTGEDRKDVFEYQTATVL